MVPIEVLTCPCCTGAMLHTLAQTAPDLLTPRSFLQLGKGALVAALTKPAPPEKPFPLAE